MTTLLNNEAAASALGVTPATLRFWRCKGKGPRFIKLGQSKQAGVCYDPADIDAWKAARKFASTSAATVQYPATA
ncbi:MAG: helix-turn-helix domain-containing protein [Novosphingobium sp.]|nr:helix-turn-helix domain-containing protein [Novosphingobium sp.]